MSDAPLQPETDDSAAGNFPPELLDKVAGLPADPGVYLFKNGGGTVIYVGKAKSLKSRVRSYFQTLDSSQFKTAFLVRRIADLDYIVTRNEKEAFLLENTLIKKYHPRYNIRLRDDKDYVSLRLDTRQPWPRLEIVRRPEPAKDVFLFGPYSSAGAVRETLGLLQKVFPLRPCKSGKFTQYKRRGRPCMDYQLKKCPGPCNDLVSKADYDELVRGAILFLKGRKNDLLGRLQTQMAAAVEDEAFERAAELRDQIRAIEQTLTTQAVARYHGADSQVIGIHREGELVTLVVLTLQEGKLVDKSEFFFPDLPEEDDVIVSDFLLQYYLQTSGEETLTVARAIPREIILPVELSGEEVLEEMLQEAAGRKVEIITPRRGSRAELRDTAALNAAEAFRKRKEQENLAEVPLRILQEKLALRKLPRRIECFDISNTMGTGAVGSMVVFTDGKPDRAEYRRFKIKTVMQADDFAMMGEVLRRRLSRGKEEGNLPDLLIVDGGKGQLAVAVHVIQELGIDSVELAGLAKARVQDDDIYAKEVSTTEERLFKPNRKNPVVLARNSSALHMVTHLRDEAHRFAITYHRLLRRKGIKSSLADIPGVGAKRQKALLRHFGSVRALKAATLEDIVGVGGMNRGVAERVYAFLHAENESPPSTEAVDDIVAVEESAPPPEELEQLDSLENVEDADGEGDGASASPVDEPPFEDEKLTEFQEGASNSPEFEDER
jgi:excinuclease ABC subunit C